MLNVLHSLRQVRKTCLGVAIQHAVTLLKNSGFSKPEKPLPCPRFRTITDFARSTSMIGMPAMALLGLSRASGLTTSFAPITTTTSVARTSQD